MTLKLVIRIPGLHCITFTLLWSLPGNVGRQDELCNVVVLLLQGQRHGRSQTAGVSFLPALSGSMGSLSHWLPAQGKQVPEGPWTRATPAHGRWWRLLLSHSIKSMSELSAYCCPHNMTSRRKPVPKSWHFGARFALAYLHLQCNSC